MRDTHGNARQGKLFTKSIGPYKAIERESLVTILDMDGQWEPTSLDPVTLVQTPPGVSTPSPTVPPFIQSGEEGEEEKSLT